MEYIVLGMIVIVGGGFALYGKKKKKWDPLVNYLLRIAGGMLGIVVTNLLLKFIGLQLAVGVNTYNLFTLGILGTPGFLLLYGVTAYFTLKG